MTRDDTPDLVQPDYASKPVTELRDVVIKAISFVNKGANGKRFFMFKHETGIGVSDEIEGYSPLIKRDTNQPHEGETKSPSGDWEVAYCVIAEPNEVDRQKDFWSEDEIRKACWDFIPSGGLLNFMHESMDKVGDLAENCLAHRDLEIMTPEGETVTIKKGSWYIAVRPDPTIKAMMQSEQITGMSVQGSAKREPVAKADKSDRIIARGTTGAGVLKLQHTLGVEETGKYDDATAEALSRWMADKGVPGTPTIATLKSCISEPVEAAAPAPAPADPAPAEAPAMEKDTEGYNPGVTDNTPSVPPSAAGIDAAHVTVDSPSDELKALIAQSLREGNQDLAEYMDQTYRGATVGDLYGQDVSHAELWYMISKYILGQGPSIDEHGDYEIPGAAPTMEKDTDGPEAEVKPEPDAEPKVEAPEGVVEGSIVTYKGYGVFVESVQGDSVTILRADRGGKEIRETVPMSAVEGLKKSLEKSSVGGSMGGHDPRANGKIRFIVRSFGKWAGGLHRVGVARIMAEHPEIVGGSRDRANALIAWVKDQWAGTTKWRHGNKNIGKSVTEAVVKALGGEVAPEGHFADVPAEHLDAMVKALCSSMGVDHGELEKALEADSVDEYLDGLHGREDQPDEKDDLVSHITKIMQSGESVEQVVAKISEVLSGDLDKHEDDGAISALRDSLVQAAREKDEAKRTEDIEAILADFVMLTANKDSGATAADGPHQSSAGEGEAKPRTFLHKGEAMDRTHIDEETARSINATVGFLTSALGGGEAVADAPAEVEKDAAPDFGGKKAPNFTAEDAPISPEEEGTTEAPEDSKPKATEKSDEAPEGDVEAKVEDELADEGDDVTEEELLQVMNHLVEEVDSLVDRITALEQLGSKLDKVGELAKALHEQNESGATSERVDALAAELTEVSKKLGETVSEQAGEIQSVTKRLDGIASTPSRSSALPLDLKVPPARQAVAKQDTSESLWGGLFR